MRRIFTPTYMFAKFDDVTPEFLAEKGIRALLIDIDNTLAPYEEPDPNERVLAWFDLLKQNGIKASLVSNNHADRVERFNAPLGLPAYPDSKKPGKKTLLLAIEKMGVDKSECVLYHIFCRINDGVATKLERISVSDVVGNGDMTEVLRRLD